MRRVRPTSDDAPVLDEQCALANDFEFLKRGAAPGLRGALQGDQLPRPPDEKVPDIRKTLL